MQRKPTHLMAAAAVVLALSGSSAAQVTARISVGPGGVQEPQDHVRPRASATGRHVVHQDSTGQVFARDRDVDGNGVFDEGNTATELVSRSTAGIVGLNQSQYPDISGDGRWVTFQSLASNLVAGDTNNREDVFVRDRDPDGNGVFEGNGVTTRVMTSTGAQPDLFSRFPRISSDGEFVVFVSWASNMLPGDTNNQPDVFRFEVATGALELVNVAAGGGFSNGPGSAPAISDDGVVIVFSSTATDISQPVAPFGNVYCRDLDAGTTETLNVDSSGVLGNGTASFPVISGDGTTAAFQSGSTNLDARDTDNSQDVFVRDRIAGTTELVSLDSLGEKATRLSLLSSSSPELSADGRRVAFASNATNLWANLDPSSNVQQLFVHDRETAQTYCVSISSEDDLGAAPSSVFSHDLSADGFEVVFDSFAENLVPDDDNGQRDIFGHTLCPDPARELGYWSVGSNGMAPTLRACGGMAGGETTKLQLRHAPASTRSACIVSAGMNPRPAFGGTLVPWQPLQRTLVLTDGTGSATAQLVGGGGPGTLFVQWLSWDKGNSPKYVLSNALEIEILP